MKLEYLFCGYEKKQEILEHFFESENVEIKIRKIADSKCWLLIFYAKGDNEKSADLLSDINDEILKNFKPTVLANECSAYYNKRLYPLFNEFERKLRELLYLKSALQDDRNITEEICELEKKDLGKIFELVFVDKDFVKGAKAALNNKNTKKEMIEVLQSLSEESLWSKLVGDDHVQSLQLDFNKIRGYRNSIMHAHNINKTTYKSAYNMIIKINEQIEQEVKDVIGAENNRFRENRQNFNSILSEAIKASELQEWLKINRDAIEILQKTLADLNNQGLFEVIDNTRKIITDIPLEDIRQKLTEYQNISQSFWDSHLETESLKGEEVGDK